MRIGTDNSPRDTARVAPPDPESLADRNTQDDAGRPAFRLGDALCK
jgi:hypothetical protein